jgi:hypothetical protein
MLGRLIKAAVIAAVLAMVIDSLPDFKRYLELRDMLLTSAGKEVIGVEVLVGFAFGYWVGTRQGRQGLQEALANVQAIMAHPETRKLLSEGLSAFEVVAAPALERVGGGRSSRNARFIGSVVDDLLERRRGRARAA